VEPTSVIPAIRNRVLSAPRHSDGFAGIGFAADLAFAVLTDHAYARAVTAKLSAREIIFLNLLFLLLGDRLAASATELASYWGMRVAFGAYYVRQFVSAIRTLHS